MDEERGKKPIAIGRFDVRVIQLIYCDFTFLPLVNCRNLLHHCNDLFITICVQATSIFYFIAYSCSQHSHNPWLLLSLSFYLLSPNLINYSELIVKSRRAVCVL